MAPTPKFKAWVMTKFDVKLVIAAVMLNIPMVTAMVMGVVKLQELAQEQFREVIEV